MKRLLQSFVVVVVLSGVQPSIAQQRTPLDPDQANYVSDYCEEHYQEDFSSFDACTLWVANHSFLQSAGPGGSDYQIALPDGDYKTYHYTLPY